jgi:FkbH-like protein
MAQSETHLAGRAADERSPAPERAVKLVVWDLDNTLWRGVLLEGDHIVLADGVAEIIRELDARGILQSLASKNDATLAMAKLAEFGLSDYFLYPQINWNSKALSVKEIAGAINIGLDTIVFIDDQAFERDEVRFSLPQVRCMDAADLPRLLSLPEMKPRFITEDSKLRRQMYLSDIKRQQAEGEFTGPKEEFLATLGMHLTIAPALEADLRRAEELTLRTNQLNTTGYTYTYEELNELRRSKRHKVLICGLTDKYGTYGKIGLAVIECEERHWVIKLLLMSCRVMARGVGTILINCILRLARDAGVGVRAEFIPNDRNRMMYVTYKFAGFKEAERSEAVIILEHGCDKIQELPTYANIEVIQ